MTELTNATDPKHIISLIRKLWHFQNKGLSSIINERALLKPFPALEAMTAHN